MLRNLTHLNMTQRKDVIMVQEDHKVFWNHYMIVMIASLWFSGIFNSEYEMEKIKLSYSTMSYSGWKIQG